MKKRSNLNFWKALLLLVFIGIFYVIIYVAMGLTLKDSLYSDAVQVILEYVRILVYVPVIFIYIRRPNTILRDLLSLPSKTAFFEMLSLILLIRFIVLLPLWDPISFFRLFNASQININTLSLRPIFPLLDFRLIILVPIVEELFFRGFILKSFLKRYSPIYAILLSSLLFALHHKDPENLVFYFLLGIVFGILYNTRKSLSICILAHIILNLFTLLDFKNIELNISMSIFFIMLYIVATYITVNLLIKDYKYGNNNNFPK